MTMAILNPLLHDPLVLSLLHLSVKDILVLSQTCKQMWELCLEKQLWIHVWNRDVLRENLPHPTQLLRLEALTDLDMKAIVINTLKLHRTMTVSANTAHTLRQVLFPQSQPITWVRLVGGTWLLVATSDSSSSVLSLFSVKSLLRARSHDLLAQAFLNGCVVNGFVELSNEHGLVIALELRAPTYKLEILSIRSRHTGSSLAFVRLARYNGISHLRALHGSLIGFALHNDRSVPSLLDWTTGDVLHLRESPNINGGAVAMAFHGDYVGVLAPRKLSVMRRSNNVQNPIMYTTIASFPLSPQIGSAAMAFLQEDSHTVLKVCITNRRGIYIYSVRVNPCHTTESLQARFTRVAVPGPSLAITNFRLISRPLIDANFGIVSWLETILMFSPTLNPVRLMMDTPGTSGVGSPSSQSAPCLPPSEREIPALYALSVRDYDPGLGLLAIGNMIGELAIYSFNGDAGVDVLDILDPIAVLEWSGQELLSTSLLAIAPSRPFLWDAPRPNEVEDLACLWDEHWPRGLAVPDNWSRASQSGDLLEDFCDIIGSASWVLETGCHFLGQPIPLIQKDTDEAYVALLTVGGLTVLFQPDNESGEPLFFALNPTLSLEEIIALLPDDAIDNEIVNTVEPDTATGNEVRNLLPIKRWEARHGLSRWQDFRKRGGRFSDYWLESYALGKAFDHDFWCTGCCSGSWSCGCTVELLKYKQ